MHQKTVPMVPRMLAATGMLVWGAMCGKDAWPCRLRKGICTLCKCKEGFKKVLLEGGRRKILILWRGEFELPTSRKVKDSVAQAEKCIVGSCQRAILQTQRLEKERIKG